VLCIPARQKEVEALVSPSKVQLISSKEGLLAIEEEDPELAAYLEQCFPEYWWRWAAPDQCLQSLGSAEVVVASD
jgi:hypothetical protein